MHACAIISPNLKHKPSHQWNLHFIIIRLCARVRKKCKET